MADESFQLVECYALPMPTGMRVRDARDLLDAARRMPAGVFERHLMQCYLRPDFEVASFPNDFALWAAECLEDLTLAEALSGLDPYHARDWEAVREDMVEILEEALWERPVSPPVRQGSELFLEDGKIILVETGVEAHDLSELRDMVAGVSDATIYHHMHGGSFRNDDARNDFAVWAETALGLESVAADLAAIDFPYYTLEELRGKILAVLDGRPADS